MSRDVFGHGTEGVFVGQQQQAEVTAFSPGSSKMGSERRRRHERPAEFRPNLDTDPLSSEQDSKHSASGSGITTGLQLNSYPSFSSSLSPASLRLRRLLLSQHTLDSSASDG